jgi:1-aminocyclopropane-1-carboxylate deaminase
MATMLPDLQNICLDHWNDVIFQKNNLHVDVLRLDKTHTEISGNKWFKLKYYLERAGKTNKKKLISLGGPYSNHLLALAVAANIKGFSSLGLIRGEEPAKLSHTLTIAKDYGMELRFLSRTDYNREKKSHAAKVRFEDDHYNYDGIEQEAMFIPEGGAGIEGRQGAGEILSMVSVNGYSHIGCAVGTGTTLAGIVNCARSNQKIIGVSVLKGSRDFGPLDISWIKKKSRLEDIQMIHDGHFGGYAKYSKSLIDFMNRIYSDTGIPTDFVYTAKLFHSIIRMAAQKKFPAGSRILVLHTGGLQGNLSLRPSGLQF